MRSGEQAHSAPRGRLGQRGAAMRNLRLCVRKHVHGPPEVLEEPPIAQGAIDEPVRRVIQLQQDVHVAGGHVSAFRGGPEQDHTANFGAVTAQPGRRFPDPLLQQLPVEPEDFHRTV